MYYELYIDVLFLENLILDYLLLRLVRYFCGCPTTQLRMWLAACFGSLGFCVLCWFSLLWTIPGMLISPVVISVLMAEIGFRFRKWRPLFCAAALLYVCSLLLGGIINWLKEIFPAPFLPFWIQAAMGVILLELFVRFLCSFRKKKAVLCKAVLFYGGVCRHVTGLWDTGNSLYDPLHRKPVSIVEKRVLEPEVSGEELLFQIPYHSVGEKNGMLPALIADYLSVQMGDRELLIERPVLGLTDEPLSSDGSYDLILNPDLTDN